LAAGLKSRHRPVQSKTCWVSVDILAVKFLRADDQDESAGTGRALDRDVEVELLLNRRIRPSWPTVAGRKLECQARRELVGGDHDPVIAPVGDDPMR
jgi:hypothetical protein